VQQLIVSDSLESVLYLDYGVVQRVYLFYTSFFCQWCQTRDEEPTQPLFFFVDVYHPNEKIRHNIFDFRFVKQGCKERSVINQDMVEEVRIKGN